MTQQQDNSFDTDIIKAAGVGTFTEQILDDIQMAMFSGPDDRRPTTIILAHTELGL